MHLTFNIENKNITLPLIHVLINHSTLIKKKTQIYYYITNRIRFLEYYFIYISYLNLAFLLSHTLSERHRIPCQ